MFIANAQVSGDVTMSCWLLLRIEQKDKNDYA